MVEKVSAEDELAIIYDEQCPVCSAYSAAVEVDEKDASAVRRINARSGDALVQKARDAGLDLNDGMVVIHKGKLYHGADALNLMARLAPAEGFTNRVNRLLFSNTTVAHVSYPLLRAGRNTLLRLLGRSKISAHTHRR